MGYIERVVEREGGFSDVDGDRGGETYRGITYDTYVAWCDTQAFDPTKEHHRSLSTFEVLEVYRVMFVNRYRIEEFTSELVREVMFSALVLHGPYNMAKIAQETAGNLKVDGVAGSKTIRRINFLPAVAFVNDFSANRIVFVIRIVENDISQLQFLEGWVVKRMLRFIRPGL